jgi:methyltransferase (TIGR00027 family)
MKAAQSSNTAGMVSAARGIGISASLRDPIAHAFSGAKLARRLRAFDRSARGVEAARWLLRALSLGLVDHNTLRMVIIDRHLRRWSAAGVRQVVVLGAGLDSRGWRLASLERCTLFEVDHPATQALKQRHAASLEPTAKRVAFVPVDFERDDLGVALEAAGHDRRAATAWVCEGVVAYLAPRATAALLLQVGARSAPGSHLALSYVTPLRASGSAVSKALVSLLVRQLGERARGFLSTPAVHELIRAGGMTAVEDAGWPDWLRQVPEYSPLPNLFKERLLIAAKP